MFPDKLRVSLFPYRFPHSGILSPLRLRWVKGVFVFRCNLPLALWQNDRGLLRATAVTRGVKRTPNKSQHIKLILVKKILPPLLPGFELANFRSRVRRSYHQAIPPLCTSVRAAIALGSRTLPLLVFSTGETRSQCIKCGGRVSNGRLKYTM